MLVLYTLWRSVVRESTLPGTVIPTYAVCGPSFGCICIHAAYIAAPGAECMGESGLCCWPGTLLYWLRALRHSGYRVINGVQSTEVQCSLSCELCTSISAQVGPCVRSVDPASLLWGCTSGPFFCVHVAAMVGSPIGSYRACCPYLGACALFAS